MGYTYAEIADMNVFQQLSFLKEDPSERLVHFNTAEEYMSWRSKRDLNNG